MQQWFAVFGQVEVVLVDSVVVEGYWIGVARWREARCESLATTTRVPFGVPLPLSFDPRR